MTRWIKKVLTRPAAALLLICVFGLTTLSACTEEANHMEASAKSAVLEGGVPPIDAAAPSTTEKATFAMG